MKTASPWKIVKISFPTLAVMQSRSIKPMRANVSTALLIRQMGSGSSAYLKLQLFGTHSGVLHQGKIVEISSVRDPILDAHVSPSVIDAVNWVRLHPNSEPRRLRSLT